MKFTVAVLALGLSLVACEESNPYTNRVAQSDGSSLGTNANATGAQTVNTESTAVAEEVSEEALTLTDKICAMDEKLQVVKGSFETMCLDGKPTVALINALDNPYTGVGEPDVNLLKAEDINGQSQFLVLGSALFPVTTEEMLNGIDDYNNRGYSYDNAVVEETQLSSVKDEGSQVFLSAEVNFSLTVTVGIIVIEDDRHLVKDFYEIGDSGIIVQRVYLQAGHPNNDEEGQIADQLAFWIPTENGTLVVMASQQHADNQGQPQTAMDVFTGLSKMQATDAYQFFQ